LVEGEKKQAELHQTLQKKGRQWAVLLSCYFMSNMLNSLRRQAQI